MLKLTRKLWGIPKYHYPAWARRNMRSKYRPHQGAKQNAKDQSRVYEQEVIWHDSQYRMHSDGRTIICTANRHERGIYP